MVFKIAFWACWVIFSASGIMKMRRSPENGRIRISCESCSLTRSTPRVVLSRLIVMTSGCVSAAS